MSSSKRRSNGNGKASKRVAELAEASAPAPKRKTNKGKGKAKAKASAPKRKTTPSSSPAAKRKTAPKNLTGSMAYTPSPNRKCQRTISTISPPTKCAVVKVKPGLNRTTLDPKKEAVNREAMILTTLYNNRKDGMLSVKATHAELKADYLDAYAKKCKLAQYDDEDLTKANWKTIARFMSRNVNKIKERGNTLRKPGSGRPETKLNAVARKIVEKAALGRGGSVAKARASLAAKGYKIGTTKLFREMRKILDFKFPIKLFRLYPNRKLAREKFADHWTLTVNQSIGINRSARFLDNH